MNPIANRGGSMLSYCTAKLSCKDLLSHNRCLLYCVGYFKVLKLPILSVQLKCSFLFSSLSVYEPSFSLAQLVFLFSSKYHDYIIPTIIVFNEAMVA